MGMTRKEKVQLELCFFGLGMWILLAASLIAAVVIPLALNNGLGYLIFVPIGIITLSGAMVTTSFLLGRVTKIDPWEIQVYGMISPNASTEEIIDALIAQIPLEK